MNIVIRVDSSTIIGSGHLSRCLAFALRLRDRGHDVQFICREYEGNLNYLIEAKSFKVLPLKDSKFDTISDARETQNLMAKIGHIDWVITDRYDINENWDNAVLSTGSKIFAIDDVAVKKRNCNILLNQNHWPGVGDIYKPLIPSTCKLLSGPKYYLLNQVYADIQKSLTDTGISKSNTNNILISFGGSDIYEAGLKVLNSMIQHDFSNFNGTLIAGYNNPSLPALQLVAEKTGWLTVIESVHNMANLLQDTNLAIGAYGVSTYERMALGVPSLILSLTENQDKFARILDEDGYAFNLGLIHDFNASKFIDKLHKILSVDDLLQKIRVAGMALVDGLGCDRVVDRMELYC
jgi:UDP-2,4-diacetamido-2,4,6-trideoxy-beta-L-altropyranose hydrolase